MAIILAFRPHQAQSDVLANEPTVATTTPETPITIATSTKASIPLVEASTVAYKELSTTTIKALVSQKFGTSSVMVKIASCESRFHQFNKDGSIYRGKANPKDVGIFQVNEHYHLAASRKMGINIYTVEGNLKYAEILYKRNGTRDWNWSKFMWEKGECKS